MKKILPLLILFICVGCTDIKYSLKFEKDNLTENIDVYDKEETHDNINNDYIGDMSAFEFFFQSLPYDATGNGLGKYLAVKKFTSFDDFLENSFVFSKIIDSSSFSINGSKVKINITSNDIINSNMFNSDIKSLSLSLYIPYYVSSHNASSVANNTYIWKFDNINDSSLKITFDMSKSYKYKKTLITIVVVSTFCVIIVGVIIYFVKKNKEANEI